MMHKFYSQSLNVSCPTPWLIWMGHCWVATMWYLIPDYPGQPCAEDSKLFSTPRSFWFNFKSMNSLQKHRVPNICVDETPLCKDLKPHQCDARVAKVCRGTCNACPQDHEEQWSHFLLPEAYQVLPFIHTLSGGPPRTGAWRFHPCSCFFVWQLAMLSDSWEVPVPRTGFLWFPKEVECPPKRTKNSTLKQNVACFILPWRCHQIWCVLNCAVTFLQASADSS